MTAWIAAHSTLVVSILGGVIIPMGVALIAHLTGKSASRVQSRGAEASAYDTARAIWGDLIDDLKSKVTDQRREIDSMRRRFDDEMQGLRARLEDLETKRAGDRHAIHLLTEYAKALLRVLKSNNIVAPDPPEGLDMDAD